MKTKLIHSVVLAALSAAGLYAGPPNVVFILADDLGIMDIASYAAHYTDTPVDELFYETPNMDRLVGEGVAFSQSYANQLCSPTRAAIMTGQYAARHGFTTATPLTRTYRNQDLKTPEGFSPDDVLEHKDNIKEPQAWINGCSNTALDPELTTLPDVLKGHHAAFIGKWHIGGHGAVGFQPLDHGFEEVPAWFDAGASYYFNRSETGHYSWTFGWNSSTNRIGKGRGRLFNVGDAGHPPHAEYLTDDLTGRAVRFLEKQAEGKDPFFLYLNHFAVHTPLQAPEKTVAHFEEKPQRGALGHSNAVYAAMVKHLDDSVGRILQTLEKTGLDQNTIVVFTSDNGGVEYTRPAATDNYPFKGGKACMFEGGVRVPLIYRLPGQTKGAWCDTPVNCIDHLPTLGALTGNDIPKDIDGISLVPLLERPDAEHGPRTFYWHYPFNVQVRHPDNGLPLTPHSAIRVGDMKLIWDWHGKLELFNISADPYEQHDLSAAMPELCGTLLRQLQDWLEINAAPRYLPMINPDYEKETDLRPYPFKDMRPAGMRKK